MSFPGIRLVQALVKSFPPFPAERFVVPRWGCVAPWSRKIHGLSDLSKVKVIDDSGGMARIFKVWDRETHRFAALKVPKEERVSAMIANGWTLGQLFSGHRCPAAVQMYGGFLLDDRLVLAMELLKGRDLGVIIQKGGAIHPADAVKTARHIARAAGAVHEAGVVLGDIKPENVIIVGGASPPVRLIDFDIAQLLDPELPSIFSPSPLMGTPPYLAPELFHRGNPGRGVKSEVYSLGVTLYNELTGKLPYHFDGGRRITDRYLNRLFDSPPVRLMDSLPVKTEAEREAIGDLDFIVVDLLLDSSAAVRPATMGEVDELLTAWLRRYGHVPFGWGQRVPGV